MFSTLQLERDGLTEVVECERTGQTLASIAVLEIVVGARDADDVEPRLDRAELEYECLPSRLEKRAGDHDVDAYFADDFERFERVLSAQDTMAAATKGLVDQVLDRCALLENENRRASL